MLWRRPHAPELSIPIEYLDAGRHVDNVQLIVGVDGNCPWLLKTAIGNSDATPDEFGLVGTIVTGGASAE
jgi:hypothetical protein